MRKKKIFLADDSITIQKVVELTFSDDQYEVTCVGNGALALQRISEVSPDIALLDVVMPETNGYEVCAAIRKHPDLSWMPVLLLTGTFEPFDKSRAQEAGSDGHLTKPFESRALVGRVQDLLKARRRPGVPEEVEEPASALPAAAPPQPAQPPRVKSEELFAKVPPGPAAAPAPQAPPNRPPTAAQGAPALSAPKGRPPGAPAPPQRPPAAARSTTPGGPPRPATRPPQPPPSPARPAPRQGEKQGPAVTSSPPAISTEALQQAVRSAVAEMSEKVIREVAWEVIPDLAEAIIRRRIRELEEEAASRA